jgi:hypothetical protein
MSTAKQKYTFVCGHCGSDDVRRDAWAAWCPETQSWELEATFDHAECGQCEGKTRLRRIPYVDPDEREPRDIDEDIREARLAFLPWFPECVDLNDPTGQTELRSQIHHYTGESLK